MSGFGFGFGFQVKGEEGTCPQMAPDLLQYCLTDCMHDYDDQNDDTALRLGSGLRNGGHW